MIGEFDFQDNFTWDAVSERKAFVSTQILFIIFFGLAAMVIMNLLIGLTVDRIEELRRKAGVIRLKKTVEQVAITQKIIMAGNSPCSNILLRTLQKRFSKYGGQFFAYTQQLIPKSKEPSLAPTLYHDLELSGKKVCFRPTRPKYSLGFISQALGRNAFRRVDKTYGIQFGTKYVELYLYNESTGMADIKTDLTLPSWIVYKTLALLNDRWKNTNADLAKRLEEEIGSYKQEQSELK